MLSLRFSSWWRNLLLVLALCLLVGSRALVAAEIDKDLKATLDAQAEAWNRGDQKAFLTTYWNSPQVSFLGKTLSRGYDGLRDRYAKSYPTKESMGSLRFELLEARKLDAEYGLVLGRFYLTRSAAGGGNATGHFTLVMKRVGNRWLIIHDHTSAL